MADYFDFNLEEDAGGSWGPRAAWLTLKIILLSLSALTTAAFFATYAAGIFANLVGDLSPILAALAGVVVFDAAAVIWSYLRSHHATTAEQMSIASAAGAGALIGSLLTTVIYLALSSGFDVGIYDPAGELSTLGQILHYGGLALVVVGVAGGFLATYLYQNSGANVRQASQRRELATAAASGRFAADKQRVKLTTARTLQSIAAQLPDLAEKQGARVAADYLAHTMTGRAEDAQAEEEQPARPFVNGKGAA